MTTFARDLLVKELRAFRSFYLPPRLHQLLRSAEAEIKVNPALTLEQTNQTEAVSADMLPRDLVPYPEKCRHGTSIKTCTICNVDPWARVNPLRAADFAPAAKCKHGNPRMICSECDDTRVLSALARTEAVDGTD